MNIDSILNFGGNAGQYIIPFIIVLSIVVFVHEFGHYWVARRCGVRVMTFSIGFGKEIFGWNDKHGTRWKVSWLPLGGFVKMFGDTDPASTPPGEEAVKAMTAKEKKVAFYSQSVAKRMAIVAAGPAANYVFAIVLLTGLFAFNGQPYTSPIVDKVMEKTAAAHVGMKPGDKVLKIDNDNIESFEDIKRIILMNTGTPVHILIERDGKEQTLNVTPDVVRMTDRFGSDHTLGRLGITSTVLAYRQLSLPQALLQSFVEAWDLTASTLQGVGQMIAGVRDTEELGGPLRIAEMSGKVAQEGVSSFVWFLIIISINLGLINLFPVPLLDGGHLVFYIAEAFRGKPISERIQEISFKAGAALVLSLMLFSTWNDLVHLRVISYIRNVFS